MILYQNNRRLTVLAYNFFTTDFLNLLNFYIWEDCSIWLWQLLQMFLQVIRSTLLWQSFHMLYPISTQSTCNLICTSVGGGGRKIQRNTTVQTISLAMSKNWTRHSSFLCSFFCLLWPKNMAELYLFYLKERY